MQHLHYQWSLKPYIQATNSGLKHKQPNNEVAPLCRITTRSQVPDHRRNNHDKAPSTEGNIRVQNPKSKNRRCIVCMCEAHHFQVRLRRIQRVSQRRDRSGNPEHNHRHESKQDCSKNWALTSEPKHRSVTRTPSCDRRRCQEEKCID